MTHMSHMWRHQMMHANRLEQTFVIDHIRWTTSQPGHEPDSWKVMCRLWIFRLGHIVKPFSFDWSLRAHTKGCTRVQGLSTETIGFCSASDESGNTSGPALG